MKNPLNLMNTETNRRDQMDEVLSAIQSADSAFLFCHVSPDGDTLGSTLALYHWMKSAGKTVEVYVDGILPFDCRYLPGIGQVHTDPPAREITGTAISIDVSAPERLGSMRTAYESSKLKLCIDHHGTNPAFGDYNVIDADAPATAVIIYRLMAKAGHVPTQEEAICLYAALSTDTGNFVYDTTTAEAFEIMAALIRTGFPLSKYSFYLFREKNLAFERLLGEALQTLRVTENDQIAGVTVSMEQMDKVNADESNTDGLVDYPANLAGVKLAYMIREKKDHTVKVSVRSRCDLHVDQVAHAFGGGGHEKAAGFSLDCSLEEAVRKTEQALKELLKG